MPIPRDFSSAVALTPQQFTEACLPRAQCDALDLKRLAILFNKAVKVNPTQLKAFYANIEALVMSDDDRLAGIKTSKLTTAAEFTTADLNIADYPTGVAYYRDATDPDLLAQRADPKDPRYARNQLILRFLNSVRGLDHAFEQLALKTGEFFYTQLRCFLAEAYSNLLDEFDQQLQHKSIEEIEKSFNSSLIIFLHVSGLDLGINKDFKKSYANLLLNYRFLAGTIEPAAAMVTKFKDHKQHEGFITVGAALDEASQLSEGAEFLEIAWPITQKTPAQTAELRKMQVLSSPEKNYHTAQSTALQLAQTLFAGLILQDDRILSDQFRKMIAPGVKNGYVTKLSVKFEGQAAKEYYFVRSGSLVYVGKGESEAALAAQTQENLQQIELAARACGINMDGVQLHSTVLVTDTGHEDGDKIVEVTRDAIHQKGDFFANVPVNALGIFMAVTLDQPEPSLSDTGRFNKADRALFAARFAFAKSQRLNTLSLFSCASGRDRTGIEDEVIKTLCIQDAYASQGIFMELTFEEALALKMQSLSSPFLGGMAASGSRGLKSASQPGKLLGEHTAQLILSTANTNKETSLSADSVEDLVREPPLFSLIISDQTISFHILARELILSAFQSYTDTTGNDLSRLAVTTLREITNWFEIPLEVLAEKLNTLKPTRTGSRGAGFFPSDVGSFEIMLNRCIRYVTESQRLLRGTTAIHEVGSEAPSSGAHRPSS